MSAPGVVNLIRSGERQLGAILVNCSNVRKRHILLIRVFVIFVLNKSHISVHTVFIFAPPTCSGEPFAAPQVERGTMKMIPATLQRVHFFGVCPGCDVRR